MNVEADIVLRLRAGQAIRYDQNSCCNIALRPEICAFVADPIKALRLRSAGMASIEFCTFAMLMLGTTGVVGLNHNFPYGYD